ncbi:MAG TPA: maleylpyruvate isomerase family mycothiol-dependent enzyme [Ilumatobacteraceae bacterium]|nr:maleylpyruvate isomerase family mycothiol-dependent enzyme [Ilumatobacteraceae bacterium]
MSTAAASSPTELPYDPHAHLRTDAVQFIDIVTTHGFEHAVPSCPDWNLGDLAWHLGNVWTRWGRIVSEGITTFDGVQAIDRPGRPSDELLIDWVTAAYTGLSSALASTSDDTEVWTWTGSNQPEIWVERRMTQETAMHRWDASNAVGLPYDIPVAVAADGIDEHLIWFAGRGAGADATPVGGTVHLHCTDTVDGGGEWLVTELDANGATFTREHAKGDAAVRGRAADLLLWLWRREAGPIEILGDDTVANRFRNFTNLR